MSISATSAAARQARRPQAEPGRISPRQGHQHQSAASWPPSSSCASREGAGEIIVAEGPGHWRNVEYLVAASGLGDVLQTYKVPFVDLNHDEPVKTPNLGRLTGLDHLYLARTMATADVVISLPKLKTHHWAGATLSLKNLFGTLPGICYGWPKNELHWRGIDNSIVDIALTRTPDLAIVDGIIGMEGDGPLNGTRQAMGVLVMGNDLLAVDATCCRLMQLDRRTDRLPGAGPREEAGPAQRQPKSSNLAKRSRPWPSRSRRCRICKACGVSRRENEIRKSKLEFRNKFEIQIRKFETTDASNDLVLVIRILVLGFCFGFRISIFEFSPQVVPPCQLKESN